MKTRELLTEKQMKRVVGGGPAKNFIYGMGQGAMGGASLGAAICAPTGVAAGACAVVGGFYGMALGALAAGIDTLKK